MKQFKTCCLILMLLLLVCVPATALAAEGGISVQLDGSNLNFTDATPVNENGRVYVPFRAVFEGMNATVDYAAETSTITATKGDTTVQFVIGNTDITVNGKTVTTDAASFVRNGRTYVPVRFAAQSLNANVGWDGNAQTVVIVDKATLKNSMKGQYTLMEKYNKFSKEFEKGTKAVKGTLKFNMEVANGFGADATMIPISGTIKVDGITTADVASMKMATELNMEKLAQALQAAGDMDEEDKAAMEALKAFDMDIIANMETGKVYVKTPLLAMAGIDGNAWYVLNLKELLDGTGMDLQSLLNSAAKSTYEEQMIAMLDTLPMNDAAGCQAMLQTIIQYQDKNFRQVGNSYVSTMKVNTDGVATSVSLTLKCSGDTVTGAQQATSVYMGTAPIMTMTTEQSGSKTTLNMNMNVQGILTMKVNGDINYSATTAQPQKAPAAGEKTVNMMEALQAA